MKQSQSGGRKENEARKVEAGRKKASRENGNAAKAMRQRGKDIWEKG